MTEQNTAVKLEDDTILPEQFFALPRERHGSRALLCAMLDDLLFCLNRYTYAPTIRSYRHAYEGSQWVLSDDPRPFGFVWVCEQLGLAPARIRTQLAPLLVREPLPRTRSGRNTRLNPLAYHKAFPGAVGIAGTPYSLLVRVGKQRARINLDAIHADSQVRAPGEVGTLICTAQAARKGGLLPIKIRTLQ